MGMCENNRRKGEKVFFSDNWMVTWSWVRKNAGQFGTGGLSVQKPVRERGSPP